MPVAKYAADPGSCRAGWLERPAPARPASGPGVLDAPTLCLTGTTVAAGSATAVVARTGANTILAATTRKITQPRRPTSADLGLRSVTWLLIRLIGILVPTVFILTAVTHRNGDWAGAALFAVAVAVGLVPEMLPVILAAAHGRGLTALARQRIIVTRPSAVQDLAGMDVLCTDKTGTLTVGRPQLARWLAPDGRESAAVLDYALLSALFTGGGRTSLDTAILDAAEPLTTGSPRPSTPGPARSASTSPAAAPASSSTPAPAPARWSPRARSPPSSAPAPPCGSRAASSPSAVPFARRPSTSPRTCGRTGCGCSPSPIAASTRNPMPNLAPDGRPG